jgi:hypothetical protein
MSSDDLPQHEVDSSLHSKNSSTAICRRCALRVLVGFHAGFACARALAGHGPAVTHPCTLSNRRLRMPDRCLVFQVI